MNPAAYVTWHSYYSYQNTNEVACSDGLNGLQTKYNLFDITTLYPMVGAFSDAPWNSTNCGGCYRLSSGASTVDITAIDYCEKKDGGPHFDLSAIAFSQLLGDKGVQDGSGYASWKKISNSPCKKKCS